MTKTKTKIGQGMFTTAYRLDDGTVELISCDHIKECMAYGWFPDSRLFPDIEHVGEHSDELLKVYHMEFFERPRSLKSALTARDWKLYQILRKLDIYWGERPDDSFQWWYDQFETIPDEYAEEREEIRQALDACANYGSDIAFEISPRNVAVKDGQLVLLDCFFVKSQLYEIRKKVR